MRRQAMKQGRRPRDLQLAVRHYERKTTRRDLRTLRYLRPPRLSLADFICGTAAVIGTLAVALLLIRALL